MKLLVAFLVLLIVLLQYKLWFGAGGIRQIYQYQQRVDQLTRDVKKKQERNEGLYAEVLDLRKGQEAIEEQARYELGMIKEDETFFQIVE
jgi:cell division protein FtsB